MQNKIFNGALIGTSALYIFYKLFVFVTLTILFLGLYAVYANGASFTPLPQAIIWCQDLMLLLVQLLFVGIGIFFMVRYKKRIPALIGGGLLSVYAFMQIIQLLIRYLSQWVPVCSDWRLGGDVYSIGMLILFFIALLLIALTYKSIGMIIVSIFRLLFHIGSMVHSEYFMEIKELPSVLVSRFIILMMILMEFVYLCLWISNEVKMKKLNK